MSNSPNLALPYVAASQAQKHVTVNDAFRRLDALVQLGVESRGSNAPPPAPQEGQRYIVGSLPTGAWAGHPLQVAAFLDRAWVFFAPSAGWTAFVRDADELLYHDGSSWQILVSLASTETVARFGINTDADSANRLKVRSEDALFEFDDSVAIPTGDVRVKLTKKFRVDSAALYFQQNYSTRAEIGIVGSDDFVIKVSEDGSTFRTAVEIDRTNGQLDLLLPPKINGEELSVLPTFNGESAFEIVLSSRAALAAAAIPATVTTVRTRGYRDPNDGGGGVYARVGALPGDGLGVADAAGGFWSLVGDTVDVRQAGAVGDGAANDTVALQRAFASGRTVFISRGTYRVLDTLETSGEHQRIIGAGRGLAVLSIPKAFGTGKAAVIRINNPFVTLRDFTVTFDQSGVAQRGQLFAYPPAVMMRNVPRCRLTGLRFERAFVGIDARENSGGAILDDIECGALSQGFIFGGSLDTVEFRNCRVWPYGFSAGTDPLFNIYVDGTTIGFRIGRIDDLNMTGCTTFQARIILEKTAGHGAFGTITDLALDGSFSRVEMSGGDIQITGVYATTAAQSDYFFDVSGDSRLSVAGFFFSPSSLAQPAVVIRDAADATFASGVVNLAGGAVVDAFRAIDTARLTVNGTSFQINPNTVRSGACVRQIGNATIVLTGNTCTARSSGSGDMIRVDGDGAHVIMGNNSAGWGIRFPAARTRGLYGPNHNGSAVVS